MDEVVAHTLFREVLATVAPNDAQRLYDVAILSRPRFACKMTYVQVGCERELSDIGRCGVCKSIVGLNDDGSMKTHNRPRTAPAKCSASGSTPLAVAEGKAECGSCGKLVLVCRSGGLASHVLSSASNKCEMAGIAPEVVVERNPLPPAETLALRVIWGARSYALGFWVDGKFDAGFIYSEHTSIRNDDRVLKGMLVGATKVGITTFERYVNEQSKAHM